MKWISPLECSVSIDRGFSNIIFDLAGYNEPTTTSVTIDAKLMVEDLDDDMFDMANNGTPKELAFDTGDSGVFMIKDCVINGYSINPNNNYVEVTFSGNEVTYSDIVSFTTIDGEKIKTYYATFHQVEKLYGNPKKMSKKEYRIKEAAVHL